MKVPRNFFMYVLLAQLSKLFTVAAEDTWGAVPFGNIVFAREFSRS